MEFLALIFFPYFGLGLMSGVLVTSANARHGFGFKGYAIMGGLHIALAIGAVMLGGRSRTATDWRSKLSPAGWVFGLALAYIAGFGIALFI